MQTKAFKNTFNSAIKDSFNFTKKYVTDLQSQCIIKNRKNIFNNLYNLKALEKYKDTIINRFENIDKIGRNMIEEGAKKIIVARPNKYEYGDINHEVVKNWTIPFAKVATQNANLKVQKVFDK